MILLLREERAGLFLSSADNHSVLFKLRLFRPGTGWQNGRIPHGKVTRMWLE